MKDLALQRRRARGFTLVELMVVVLIVGILASIGVPAYRSYVLRVKRADAKVALTTVSQTLERCFTRFNAYNNAGCTVALPYDVPQGAAAGERTYTIGGAINANGYRITATRVDGQVDDTDCGDFALNEQGTQGVANATKTAAQCWR